MVSTEIDEMTNTIIANLEKLLGGPRDGALLRYALGNEWLKNGDPRKAADYFQSVVTRDPQYSAGWKQLGKALAEAGDISSALEAYQQGIAVAKAKGDIQAAKEMHIFAKRLTRQAADTGTQSHP